MLVKAVHFLQAQKCDKMETLLVAFFLILVVLGLIGFPAQVLELVES